ncbi:MAG TPA: hypothetical protein VJA87_01210 [Candidatus Paceibacterota bacterium]
MLTILVLERPFPDDTADPDDIRDSYIGLKLAAESIREAGHDPYPNGAYMVLLPKVLKAMARHYWRAYKYLHAKYSDFSEVADMLDLDILLPFSQTSCEVIQ